MKRDLNLKWHNVDPGSLRGRRTIVVGGTGGVGRAVSQALAARGAQVTVVGQTFRDADIANISFIQADLSLLKDAERVARELPVEQADLLVFTTGIFAAPKRQVTAEGIERDMAVSYLNRLVMLRNLAPRLGTQRIDGSLHARVFIMGYPGTGQLGTPDDLNSEQTYKVMAAHMNTVAGNEALVVESAHRYPTLGVFGLNPGLIKSSIRSNLMGADSLKHRIMEWLIGKLAPSADDYAARILPLLVSPDLDQRSGAFFNRKAQAILPSEGMNETYSKRYIAASEALIAKADVSLSD
ncbi:SDR family NAD(P)-dependent oxidoreductase [Gluconobacter cerinus]|uniref:SDR family NAD(P)-dependent oxidoreductase n=1 Tax=Gluconobacter cerinus TaxID=38307 RepID=UPI001B8B8B50|nr:SDR family NAD(P)-dependent oxidoreductase [Gluconobacter cerinus]MBS1023558.1 SDR family NAD(P)-dependent oxidoreductase [Gluconobacter cerinus]MBS1045752.1 SDR family NAD(P)-dependent oxidoreductase [Gluconobacter cerinus]